MNSTSVSKMVLLAFLLCLSTQLNLILGEIICEELPVEVCALSIASSGKRCLLENYSSGKGEMEFQCRTSEVLVEKMAEWIETDQCVSACGLDRKATGISSDMLLEPLFTVKLCSAACYNNCPNIVDLYFNLAAGEGLFLPYLCKNQRETPHRQMAEVMISGVDEGRGIDASSIIASTGAPLPAVAGIAPAPTSL